MSCTPVPQVPLDGDLKITDDTRIRAAVPTLKYLTDNGAKVGKNKTGWAYFLPAIRRVHGTPAAPDLPG